MPLATRSLPDFRRDNALAPLMPPSGGGGGGPSSSSSASGPGARAGLLHGRASPYEPGAPFIEELKILRRKNQKLEAQVRRLHGELGSQVEIEAHRQHEVETSVRRWQAEAEAELEQVQERFDLQIAQRDAEHQMIIQREVSKALDRQLVELTGSQEERDNLQAEREREARVETFRRQVMRRLLNQSISFGFTAWVDYWEAHVYAHARIREVANHLSAPGLTRAFHFWQREWEAERTERLLTQQKEQLEKTLKVEVARLTSELKHAKESAARRLEEAEKAKADALESLRVELTGTAEEQARLREKEERAARVDAMRSRITRRILHRDLSLGFDAWGDFWSAKVEAMALLRMVGNKLRAPELSEAFRFWVYLHSHIVEAKRQKSEESKWTGALAESTRLERELAEARAELSRRVMQLEEEKRTSLERLRIELTGSAAEKAEALAEAAREERISLYCRHAMRRMMADELRRGFMAWHLHWEAVLRAKLKLRNADETSASTGAFKERDALLEECATLRAELEAAMARAEESKRIALERQFKELTGSAEEQASVIEEKEKEARIQLIKRQMARRMLNMDLGQGWAAWVELARAKRDALTTLRHCANLLKSPDTLIAFEVLATHAANLRRAKAIRKQQSGLRQLAKDKEDLGVEVKALREESAAKLAAAKAEHLQLLERVAALSGSAEDAAKLLHAERESARQERIETFRRHVVRRLLHSDLDRGWTVWVELYRANGESKRLMRRVSGRLSKPRLQGAMSFWVRDYQLAERAANMTVYAKREAELLDELRRVQASCEARVIEVEEKAKVEYERRIVEMTGTAEERLEVQEQRMKEERVELLRRQITRRMANRKLFDGWSAWVELSDAKRYSLARLRECSNRLRRPDLAFAFREWLSGNEEEAYRKQVEAIEAEAKSMESQLRRARFERGQLEMVKIKMDDEMSDLKRRLAEFERQQEALAGSLQQEKRSRLEVANLPHEMAILRERLAEVQEEADAAEKKRLEAEEDASRQQMANAQLLEKLLAQQRREFEEQLSKLNSQVEENEVAFQGAAKRVAEAEKAAADAERRHKKEMEQAEKAAAEAAAEAAAALAVRVPSPKEKPPKKEDKKKASILGQIDLDESEGAPPIRQQIGDALRKNSTRVIDLFREWDTDGDGEVDRKEFHKAMPALGLDVPKAEIDALFDEWGGKDGAIDFAELSKILRRKGGGGGGDAAAAGAGALKKVGKAAVAASAMKK